MRSSVLESAEVDASPEPTEPSSEKYQPAAHVERGLAFAAVLGCIVSGVIVVAASRRGLGLTDESLYYLMADDPERAMRSASGFHVLLHPLFELSGKSIVTWRLVRAVFDVGTDLAFGFALLHFLRTRSPEGLFSSRYLGIALVAGVSSIGYTSWAWTTNGFGYNELGSMLSTVLAAILLLLAANPQAAGPKMFVYAGLFGAVLTPAAITRWSSAVAISIGVVAVFALCMTLRKTAELLAAIGVGAALSALFIHYTLLDMGSIIEGIQSGTVDVASGTHSSSELLKTYWLSVRLGVQSYLSFAVALCFALFGIQRWRSGGSPITSLTLLVLAVLLSLAGERLLGAGRIRAVNDWAAVPLGLGLLLVALRVAKVRASVGLLNAARTVIVPLVLIAIPIGSSAGTDNPILLNSIILAELWVGAIVILGAQFSFRGRLGSVVVASLIVLAGGVPLMAFESLLAIEYWFIGNQEVSVERGRFAGLTVDETTRDLLHDLEDIRVTLEPDPTVISLWVRPSVTYALDGHGIGFPWYTPRAIEASAATIDGACADDGFVPSEQIVLVTEVTTPADMQLVHGALRRCGIDFPADFSYVKSVTAPPDVELRVYTSSS